MYQAFDEDDDDGKQTEKKTMFGYHCESGQLSADRMHDFSGKITKRKEKNCNFHSWE